MRFSILPMLRLFMFQCFLTMLFALPLTANAQYMPGPGPGDYHQRHMPVEQLVEARINHHVSYRETLPLRQIIKSQTRTSLRGLKLEQVIIEGSPANYYSSAQAQLIINGAPVGYPQTLKRGYAARLVFPLPRHRQNVFGQDLRSVQLLVTGAAQIRMAGFVVDSLRGPGSGGYNRSVQVLVNRSFYGSERVALQDLLRHAGRLNMNAPVEALTIVARGQGSVMATGAGSVLGSISVDGRSSRGQSIRVMSYASVRDIKLRINGNLTIQSIRIKTGR